MNNPERKRMKDEPVLTISQVKEVILGSLISQFGKVADGYDSPLKKIAAEVINENAQTIKQEFSNALQDCFADKEFMSIVRQEFKHKVAKNLVGKLEGEVEKAVAVLRQDPTMRSKMILAIERIVNGEDSV